MRTLLFLLALVLLATAASGSQGGAGGGDGHTDPSAGDGQVQAPDRTWVTFPRDMIERATAPIMLPGGGGVTHAGQATYTLPLQTPDGPAGIKPELAIHYGGGGNGRLGTGMSLSGLSAIAPCRQTVAADGEATGIRFDKADAFCLDGVKLVKAEGNSDNSKPNHYRTETETFRRIVATYASTNDPQPTGFEVWHRDGSRSFYKGLVATRLQNEGNPADASEPTSAGLVSPVYPIHESIDATGVNRIEYHYETGPEADARTEHDFSYRISEIRYSFSSLGAPRRKIRFQYEHRDDPIVHYASGVKTVVRSRLSAIEAYAPNPVSTELVWTYRLAYEIGADSKRSRLQTVKLCEQLGECSFERKFAWTEPAWSGPDAGLTEHVVSSQGEFNDLALSRGPLSLSSEPLGNWYQGTDTGVMLFDADGDGLDDCLYRTDSTHFETSVYADAAVLPRVDYSPGRIAFRRSIAGAPLSSASDLTSLLEPSVWAGWSH